MMPKTQTKAKLKVLESAETFSQALRAHEGQLKLLIEWTLEKPRFLEASSGAHAENIFQDSFQKDPRHLHFRAFNEKAEYAWFGTVGVQIELTPEGDELEVEEQEQIYYAASPMGDDAKMRVQRLMHDGRVVYEKLLGAPTLPTDSIKAEGGDDEHSEYSQSPSTSG